MVTISQKVIAEAEARFPEDAEKREIFMEGANCALDVVNELMCKTFGHEENK